MFNISKSHANARCGLCSSKLSEEVYKVRSGEKQEFCSKTCAVGYDDADTSYHISNDVYEGNYQHGTPLHDQDDNCCKR